MNSRLYLVALATALPTLLAFNTSPSSTIYNQLLALGAWGFALLVGQASLTSRTGGGPVSVVLLLLAAVALAQGGWTGGALASFSLMAAWVCFHAGRCGAWDDAPRGLALGLVIAGGAGVVIGAIQVYAPQWVDGIWIARSGYEGRAVGNLRQPNHLATWLLWAAVGWVWWGVRARWSAPKVAAGLALFTAGVVLTASRTGLYLGVPLLLLWGLFDRQLPRGARWALAATPLYALGAWLLFHGLSAAGLGAFGAEIRLDEEGAGSPSRIKILLNTWTLLQTHPWTGVGWGEFNRAWTLSVFPDRPIAFFDHSHNLPLQLLVELGWPLGLLVLGLLAWGLLLAVRAAGRAQGEGAVDRRAPLMVILIVGVHSMLEYPLWYLYFLLPTAFAWGLCVTPTEHSFGPTSSGGAALRKGLGLALLLGSAFALWEYQQVAAIYAPAEDGRSLRERIQAGQRTRLFSAQADYAAATTLVSDEGALQAAQRTAHHFIDARLLMAWAKQLHARGEADPARYLVARLREFRSREGSAWLSECETDAGLWFCQSPERAHDWRGF
ncbi:PglL family O-oligosaccharyltransferase [Inhella gelatinilytica]|uniref:O-antigen ligase C-terminal domain-containing protein n=1 Tax=Inhella gelatinilytica TaxID=2795030 RepID=A0A931ND34_9BURK|nr:O-antigen ligase family protein [Inhella gelatinilytica]MBH9551825.1 O-antigen ligase C-terminal domain-containing protein [Inhella gelatinilytica]